MDSIVKRMRRVIGVHFGLVAAAVIIIAPVIWTVGAGLRYQISLLMGDILFAPTLDNFRDVLLSKTSDFIQNYLNSLYVGVASTFLCLVIGFLAAWSLNRSAWPRWIVHVFLGWTLVFHMIPPVALAGAWYQMARMVGLDNTYAGLILAHTVLNLPMAIWLLSVFVRDVPVEMEEAAVIDGASTPVLLRDIMLPLCAPGLAATGVLTFIFSWNEFAVALTLTQKATATVPVAIAKYAQDFEILYTQMAAAAALSILPALLLLIFAQRFIEKGLTQGAVK